MFFGKSITFDGEELNETALAVSSLCAVREAELEFVERLKEHDADAFDVLVNKYSSSIFALLVRLTQDQEEARDLTQDTFLSALRAIGKFRGDADLKTWLYRIAINESRNRFRWWKRRNRSSTISLDAETPGNLPYSETIADGLESPEDAAIRRERENALHRCLGEIPAKFREVIVLRDIEGMSYDDIAAALETNIGTVKSRIARGRDELRKRMTGF